MKNIKLPIKGEVYPIPGKPVCLGEVIEIQKEVEEIRKKVIGGAIAIESLIESLITIALFPEDKGKMRLFSDIVLSREQFSFMMKWKVLSDLTKANPIFTDSKETIKNLGGAIENIITYRNAFAHGTVVFRDKVPHLRYFKGKVIEKEVDDNFLSQIEKDFHKTHELLQELYSDIHKKVKGET